MSAAPATEASERRDDADSTHSGERDAHGPVEADTPVGTLPLLRGRAWWTWLVGVSVAAVWAPVLWKLAGTNRQAYRVLGINDFELHVEIARNFGLDLTQVEAPHLLFHAASAAASWVLGDRLAVLAVLLVAVTLSYMGVLRLVLEPGSGRYRPTERFAAVVAAAYFFTETPTLILMATGLLYEHSPYQTIHWWGNPTWLVALPVSLLTLPAIEGVVQDSDGLTAGRPGPARVRLVLLVVLGALAKPTLTLVLPLSLPVYLLMRRSRLRTQVLMFALVTVPVGVVVAAQTWFIGSGSSESFSSGFIFDPIVEPFIGWENMGPVFWLPMLIPLAALVVSRGRFLSEPFVQLTLVSTLFAYAVMFSITETGGRAAHGNMAVPAQMCVALLIVLSVRTLAIEGWTALRGEGPYAARSTVRTVTLAVCATLAALCLMGGALSYLDAMGVVEVPTDWLVRG